MRHLQEYREKESRRRDHGHGVPADMVARHEKQASESRLKAIVQGALDAVVTMDRTGHVVEWNPRAEMIFGYSRDEAVGRLLTELIIPVHFREAHATGMQRFLSTGEQEILGRRIEITALRKNGTEFPVELTVIPLHLGQQVLFSSFIRDISERKESESALRQTATFIESLFDHLPNMVFVKDAQDLCFNQKRDQLHQHGKHRGTRHIISGQPGRRPHSLCCRRYGNRHLTGIA